MAITRSEVNKQSQDIKDNTSNTVNKHDKVSVLLQKHPLIIDDYNWEEEQVKDPNYQEYLQNGKLFKKDNNKLYRKAQNNNFNKIFVPSHLEQEILNRIHSSVLCAHGRKSKTSYYLRYFGFPGLSRKIRDHCHSCIKCLASKGKMIELSIVKFLEDMDKDRFIMGFFMGFYGVYGVYIKYAKRI